MRKVPRLCMIALVWFTGGIAMAAVGALAADAADL